MPKLSFEGLAGIVLALIVLVLDQAGVKNTYVLWSAFALAVLLCVDALRRSDYSRRKKAVGYTLVVIVSGVGFYLTRDVRRSSEKIEQVEMRGQAPLPPQSETTPPSKTFSVPAKHLPVNGIRRGLQIRFSEQAPYRLESPPYTQFRIGIHNPGPTAAENVMVKLTDIKPRPRDTTFRAAFPYHIYDANLREGIVVNPDEEELFVLATVWTSGDGRLMVGELDRRQPGYASFSMDVVEVWHLQMRVTTANANPIEIVLEMRVENGGIHVRKL